MFAQLPSPSFGSNPNKQCSRRKSFEPGNSYQHKHTWIISRHSNVWSVKSAEKVLKMLAPYIQITSLSRVRFRLNRCGKRISRQPPDLDTSLLKRFIDLVKGMAI